MPKTVRTYVSAHTYRTPSGLYYDDRSGKRLTARRGHANETSKQRMDARVRDENGKLTFQRVKVSGSQRSKTDKKRTGSPEEFEAEVDSIYDQEKNETLFIEYVERKLNAEHPEYAHFDTEFLEAIEE